MKRPLLLLLFLLSFSSFASECRVSFDLKNEKTMLSDQSLLNLQRKFESILKNELSIDVVEKEKSDFHIVVGLLDWTDHHNQKIHNAYASLSLYVSKDLRMFSYSQHFGKRFFRRSLAGSEKNFLRANGDALKTIESCQNLLDMSQE